MNKYPLHIIDQIGQKIEIKNKPQRIVSLVPSITYTLHRLELEDEVVGITRFCKFPENWKKKKTIIGGTKDIKIKDIAQLKPDLIIANKEENSKESVEALRKIAPVYISNVFDLKSNTFFLQDLGKILDKEVIAKDIINNIKKTLISFQQNKKIKSIYLIWRKPWMSVGSDTFISQMMQYVGFENLLKNKKRYPIVKIEELQKLNPEVILLCSEPFPFKNKHQKEMKIFFPNSKILIVQGEAFTWFGAYPEKALIYLNKLQKNAQ